MIRVSVFGLAANSVPASSAPPGLAAVFSQVQINAAADHVIRIRGVHYNRVAIGNLAFAGKMTSANFPPRVTAVRAAKNAEHPMR